MTASDPIADILQRCQTDGMSHIRFPFIAVFAFFLSSCQIGVDILIDGPASAPLFRLKTSGWFGGAPAHIDSMEVYMSQKRGEPVVWRLESDKCQDITQVSYGTPPSGFVESINQLPLREGVEYRVSVSGCGSDGRALFRIVGDHVE